VLVVDDDRDMLSVIKAVLEDDDCAVDAAADGLEALVIARSHMPDLVVLDATLPTLDSGDVAAQLHELGGPTIPILVITADGRASEKARRLGAYAYLRKPFELDHFLTEVHRGLH
jgi:CheY-like chemotaxis protein